MHKRSARSGFTLVELSFSIAFISVLSLTLVLITLNLTSMYQKGLTLKQVNTIGEELVDDFRNSISNSSVKSILDLCSIYYKTGSTEYENCSNDGAYSFIDLVRTADVEIIDGGSNRKIEQAPVYGAFCTGLYSYIWNSGYLLDEDAYKTGAIKKATFTYYDMDGEKQTRTDFRLLKIRDTSRSVCTSKVISQLGEEKYDTTANLSDKLDNNFEIKNDFGYIEEEPVDILDASKNASLALYELSVDRPAQDSASGNAFYTGSFILATILGGINIMSSDSSCAPPTDYKIENFEYCAMNKFNFAVRAIGD